MKNRYRKRIPTIEAEQFRPDLNGMLPEGVEESLTPGKYWLRGVQHGRMTRTYVKGISIKPFDFIVVTGEEKIVMSQEHFKETYEEA